jgi:predicted lipoprotein with Yx(FWY)xxD motif
MKRTMFLLAGFAAITLTLAACSNSSTSTPPAGGGTSTSSSSSGGAMTGAETVKTVQDPTYGTILTDGEGNTLYLFEQDQGTKTSCTTGCSSTWPALTVTGQPTAGAGVDANLLGSAKQDDGSTQVTYNGHLVYRYSGDTAPGQTNGEGISNVWFVVSAAGDPVQQGGAGGSSSSGYSRY